MSPRNVFRPVGPDEARWHDELSWHPAMADLFWLDGELDNGFQIGVGLLRSRPLVGGMPAITMRLLTPEGEVIEVSETFEREAFTPTAFGGTWGDRNRLNGELDEHGTPIGFELSVAVEDLELDVTCRAVCVGAKFVDRSPGFTAHDETTGSAAGWWPLIPRATSSGTLSVGDTTLDATGAFHIERQVSSFPLAGSAGEKSAQSIWGWGHFYAGDYTAIWTDSAASEHFGHHHFTPFLLWKGSDLVLSTFAFASYVERFTINANSGLALPIVTTLKASDQNTDFFARLVNPRCFEHVELNDKPGSIYCRQLSEVAARMDGPAGTDRFTGRAVHEWGTQAGNFPFTTQNSREP
jgi:hypothetical protein